MNAILYTSNTCFTAQYAKMLGDKLGLPVAALEDAPASVAPGTEILYLGWLMAGTVKGYGKAAKRYPIKAVCGVGMGAGGSQLEEVRRKNAIPEKTELFVLQGGFDLAKLHGVYRLMMRAMKDVVGRKLAKNPDKTEAAADMLDLMMNGGSRVSEENLRPVLAWYKEACKGV